MAVALQLGNKVVAMASEGTKLCLYADGQRLPQEPGLADGFSGSFALLHRGSEEAWAHPVRKKSLMRGFLKKGGGIATLRFP